MAIFVDPQGQVVQLPDDQTQDAVAQGYAPASVEQADAFDDEVEAQRKYSTPGQQILTGVEGAGRTLTFGISDILERALAYEVPALLRGESATSIIQGDHAKPIRERERINEGAATLGSVLGVVAPAVVSGGASLLGEGAAAGTLRGASELAAPSLISRAGRGLVGALEGSGAELGVRTPGLLPQATGPLSAIVRKAAAEAMGGAVEGGLYGLGEVVHEGLVGDPDLTAESALGTVGLSALLGGGLGTGLGIVEAGIPQAARTARDAISRAFTGGENALKGIYQRGESVTGVPGDTAAYLLEHKLEVAAAERVAPGITEDLANATPEMTKFVIDNQGRFAAMEQAFPGTTRSLARADVKTANYLLDNWQKIFTDQNQRNDVAKNLFEGARDVINETNELLRKANTEILPVERKQMLEEIRGLANRKKVELTRETALRNTKEAVRILRSEPDVYSATTAREMEILAEGLERDLAPKAKGWHDPATVFERLRELKQQIGDISPTFGKDALAIGRAERNAGRVLSALYGNVKQALVDETVFGPTAMRQAVMDDIQREWISLMKPGGSFAKRFMEKVDGKLQLKTTKVSTWLNQMADAKSGTVGDLRGRDAAETWGRMMDGASRIVNEVEQSSRFASVPHDFNGVRDLLDRARGATSEAQERAAVTLTKAGLEGRTLLSSHPIVSPAANVAGQVAAAAVPSTVRSAVNVIRGAASVPRTVAVLAALEQAGTKTAEKIATLSTALVRKTAPVSRAVKANVEEGGARELGKDERKKTRLHRYEKQIRQIVTSLDTAIEVLHPTSAPLQDHAPNVALSVQRTQARAVQFLATKLPEPPDFGPLAPKWEPSQAEQADFERVAAVVDDPLTVLRDAKEGTLTPDMVEALATVYPSQYVAIQSAVFNALMEHGAPDYNARLMLSMLLGQDLDGSLASVSANQATFQGPSESANAPAATAAGASNLTLAQRSATEEQRSAMRS